MSISGVNSACLVDRHERQIIRTFQNLLMPWELTILGAPFALCIAAQKIPFRSKIAHTRKITHRGLGTKTNGRGWGGQL